MATRAASSKKGYALFIRDSNEIMRADTPEKLIAHAIKLAKQKTKRQKVFDVLPTDSTEPKKTNSDTYTAIYTNRVSNFCHALASSEERVAAVVVTPDERDLKYKSFLREIRELTSAEGAVLIWKELKLEKREKDRIPTEFFGIQPDIVCWNEERNEDA